MTAHSSPWDHEGQRYQVNGSAIADLGRDTGLTRWTSRSGFDCESIGHGEQRISMVVAYAVGFRQISCS
jgi:hypothetical protein